MKKSSVSNFVKNVKESIDKHSPEILTGVGVAGMVATTVLAVKATPKALVLIDEAENEKNGELTKTEIIKAAWKPYIPAMVTGVLSTTCVIGALSVNSRRTAAIATAYKLSETALNEFRDKAVEVVGEQKVKEIKEKISEEKIEKTPVTKNEVYITEKGNTLFFDGVSGRYFKNDLENIKRCLNKLNKEMLSDMYISLSEFYIEIGLDPTSVSNELGWNIDGGLIEIDYIPRIADDGTPCIALEYLVAPRYDFSKLY